VENISPFEVAIKLSFIANRHLQYWCRAGNLGFRFQSLQGA